MTENRVTRRLVCKVCYRSLPQAATGRPRLTCSDACRKSKSRQNSDYEWQMLRRRAAKQIRRYEKRLGDFSLIPAYRNDPNETMSLRDRLMIYLPRGMRVLECWTCHRPYMPHGQLSPTCSDACTRARAEYFKRLHDNFYRNPRRLPPEIYDYIRAEKRLKFCPQCDDPFVPTRSDRKYCGDKCRKLAWKQRNPRWRCRVCGAACPGRWHYCTLRCFHRHRSATKSFCARCQRTIKAGAEIRPEAETHLPRKGKRAFAVFCSTECRDAVGWLPTPKTCEECGTAYQPARKEDQATQRYCSEGCRNAARVRRQLERNQEALPQRFCIHCDVALPKGRQRKYCVKCVHLRNRDRSRRYRERLRVGRALEMPSYTSLSVNDV